MQLPASSPEQCLIGVDFSSRPSRTKPVVVAHGRLEVRIDASAGGRSAGIVRLDRLEALPTLDGLGALLATDSGAGWVGAFDFPFGLPRELVETLGWPTQWPALMAHLRTLGRPALRDLFKGFCAARPVGAKFAHRATDGPAGSSPSMKWVNPPVAWMLHAGVPLLIDAGVHLPGLHDGDRRRVALEGYPGLLARELIGQRSYKADDRARQTPERLIARKDIVDALEQGRSRLGLRLRLTHAQRDALVDDPQGDRLDAVLCLMQAGWAARRPGWGLPAAVDPLEGWIVTAVPAAT